MDLQVQYMPVQVLAHSGHSLSLGQPAAGEVSDLQMTDQRQLEPSGCLLSIRAVTRHHCRLQGSHHREQTTHGLFPEATP